MDGTDSALYEGFTKEYVRDFGTLVAYQREPLGETYCPACEEPCNKHTGHRLCRETYANEVHGPRDPGG